MPILISLAGACLIGLLVYGISTQSASRTLDTEVHDGQRPAAPDASAVLPVLGGHGTGSLASAARQGRAVELLGLVVPAVRTRGAVARAGPGRPAALRRTVLGVTYKDATPDSEEFVRQFHLTYPSLRDGTGSFAAAYGTDQLPESFIVDRHGHVVTLYRGEIGQGFIEKAIALARVAMSCAPPRRGGARRCSPRSRVAARARAAAVSAAAHRRARRYRRSNAR